MLLTACAGFVDAVGFIELGGYYTSFMSGNTTQIGALVAASAGVLLPVGLVGAFLGGSVVGSLLALRGPRWGPSWVLAFVVVTVAACLGMVTAGIAVAPAMLVLAAGAGAQNAALPYAGGARLGTTFVTGTLFAAGQDLAGALAGKAPRWRWVQQLGVWSALLVGALLGAFGYNTAGLGALVVPAGIYMLMLVGFAVRDPAG